MAERAPKPSAKRSDQPRRLALEICLAVLERGESLSRLFEHKLLSLTNARDRAFCSELCFGFCRYYFVLDTTLQRLLKKPFKKKDQDIAALLMLGLLQIRFMRVSDHAAVNESVGLLRALRKDWAKGLVNGLLRNYARELADIADASALNSDEQKGAYPAWMAQRVLGDWPEAADRVFAAGNQQAPLVIRVDTAQQSRAGYLSRLAQENIAAQEHEQVATAVILDKAVGVEQLPDFASGGVSVQDAAAQLAAELLDCESGMRVLDACAAPGGKTLHLLQRSPSLELVALDKDGERMARVAENLERAELSAELFAADAAELSSWHDGRRFQRILLDAPCSASGILRRHPDIRLLRRDTDIAALAEQQRRLLKQLWTILEPGGILLYCTCSIFKQENERQIEQFLNVTPDGESLPISDVCWGQDRGFGRQILPGVDDMDGFFYARLRKRSAGE